MQFGQNGMGMQMGGMNPMMGGMNPMMGGVNPMMTGMGGMNPMMGGVNPMMGGMGGVNPMMGGMGGVNPMMGGMGGVNPMMGINPMAGMGGVNPGMPQVSGVQGQNINVDDPQGWNLIFENQTYGKTVSIIISEQKFVKEAISMYLLKTGITDKCKFIFNNKELFPEMKICQSGLTNLSRITVISTKNIIGAI